VRPVHTTKGSTLSEVTFNDLTMNYETAVRSDSDYRVMYRVSYDPREDQFSCDCPAFRYSRDRYCKHISRAGGTISDYIDSLYSDDLAARLGADEDPPTPNRYSVTLNGGAEKHLDGSTVEWLFTALRSGDELLVQKL